MELLGKPSEEFMDKISSDSVIISFFRLQTHAYIFRLIYGLLRNCNVFPPVVHSLRSCSICIAFVLVIWSFLVLANVRFFWHETCLQSAWTSSRLKFCFFWNFLTFLSLFGLCFFSLLFSVDFHLSFLIGPHRHRSTDAYHGTNGDAKCWAVG